MMPGFVAVGKKQSRAARRKLPWMARGVGMAGPPIRTGQFSPGGDSRTSQYGWLIEGRKA